MADFAYLEDDNELGITNYEEYFNEIFEDYLRLASFTRLPEFRDTEEELPGEPKHFSLQFLLATHIIIRVL